MWKFPEFSDLFLLSQKYCHTTLACLLMMVVQVFISLNKKFVHKRSYALEPNRFLVFIFLDLKFNSILDIMSPRNGTTKPRVSTAVLSNHKNHLNIATQLKNNYCETKFVRRPCHLVYPCTKAT